MSAVKHVCLRDDAWRPRQQSFQNYSFEDRHPTPPHLDRFRHVRQKRRFLQAKGLSASAIVAVWAGHYSNYHLSSEISELAAQSSGSKTVLTAPKRHLRSSPIN